MIDVAACRVYDLDKWGDQDEVKGVVGKFLDELGGVPVFCYGTLMRGYGNNALFRRSEYLGDAVTTVKAFDLSREYGYPVVYFPKDGERTWRVRGELWLCEVHDFVSAYMMEMAAEYDLVHTNVDMVDDREAGSTEALMFAYQSFTGEPQDVGRDEDRGVVRWVRKPVEPKKIMDEE